MRTPENNPKEDSNAYKNNREGVTDQELDRMLQQVLLPADSEERQAEEQDLKAIGMNLWGSKHPARLPKRPRRVSPPLRRFRTAASTDPRNTLPVWVWPLTAAAAVLILLGWAAMQDDDGSSNNRTVKKEKRQRRKTKKQKKKSLPVGTSRKPPIKIVDVVLDKQQKKTELRQPEPDVTPFVNKKSKELESDTEIVKAVESIKKSNKELVVAKKALTLPDRVVIEEKPAEQPQPMLAGQLKGPRGAWQIVSGPDPLKVTMASEAKAWVGKRYLAESGAALRLSGGVTLEVLDAEPAILRVEQMSGGKLIKGEQATELTRNAVRLYAGRVRISMPKQGVRLVLHCGEKVALCDAGTTYVVNVRSKVAKTKHGQHVKGEEAMRGIFGKTMPVLFALAVTTGSVQVWEGGQMSVAHASEGVSFTVNDVCSMSGCGLENTFYSNGEIAYVQVKYVKNAKTLGKRTGHVDHLLYDLGTSKLTILDPVKKTYSEHKLSKQQVNNTKTLIKQLKESTDAKSFLGQKKEKGLYFTFKTITTTVTKAEKLAKVDERKLAVPAGYKKVKASKKRR